MCGSALDAAVARLSRLREARITQALRRLHPGWDPDLSTCPECVLGAVQALHRQRSPDYASCDTRLLPTPVRVHAHPGYTGRGVTIAFLDSGFYPHPDLTEPASRIQVHMDATYARPVERPRFRQAEVTSWHGLMVSGVAAGNGHQSGGVYRGPASEASLVLVRTGNRRSRRIPDRDILRALQWVVDHHARYAIRVVNLSIGGDFASTGAFTPLDDLVEAAVARGLVVVAAAGNGGVNAVIPPASAPAAITVGGLDDQNSLDRRDHRMWRSSFGRGAGGVPKPDVIAPSIWVPAPMLPRTWAHNEAMLLWRLAQAPDAELSRLLRAPAARARLRPETLNLPLDGIRLAIRRRIVAQKYVHPHYQHADGTSMAAAVVSGIAAQMLEANPGLTPAQVKDLILQAAQPLCGVPRAVQGHGAVEAARAVAGALRATGGPLTGLPPSPHVTPEAVTFVCHAPGARQVALVGSFNGWQPAGGAMQPVRPGVWHLQLPVPRSGTHAYKFLIDGRAWTHDVENPAQVEDGFGGVHSLLTIPPSTGGA